METIKDSEFINALITFVVLVFVIGIGVILLYLHFQKNLLHQKLKQETLKNIHQHELLRSNIETQEEERKRIAQDLHDELGAVLSIMQMNLVLIERKNERAAEIQLSELQNIRQLAQAALASMRHISHRLMPPQLETFGLIESLKSFVEQINKANNLHIRLNTDSSFERLSLVITISLYRIIMELINNTIKHSAATRINIDMGRNNRDIICRYSDNGCGLAGNTNMNKGIGQKSIDARISALGGTFNIDHTQNTGYHVSIQIPLE